MIPIKPELIQKSLSIKLVPLSVWTKRHYSRSPKELKVYMKKEENKKPHLWFIFIRAPNEVQENPLPVRFRSSDSCLKAVSMWRDHCLHLLKEDGSTGEFEMGVGMEYA